MIDLVRGAGLMAWALLLILAVFSVVSWSIILDRVMLFRKADRESDEFLESFRGSAKFSQAKSAAQELETSPMSGMFLAAYAELAAFALEQESPIDLAFGAAGLGRLAEGPQRMDAQGGGLAGAELRWW